MQLRSTVDAGDYVSIPKGTSYQVLSSKWASARDTDEKGVTTRDAVVKVARVDAIYSDEMVTEDYQVYVGHGGMETRQRKVRKITGFYVEWAGGKYTLESNVTKAEAPVRKERAEPAKREPTLRQRMVPKTKWKLTKDAKLVKKGPAYRELIDDGVIPAGTIVEVVDKFTTYGPGYTDGLWVSLAFPGWKSRQVEFSEINQNPEQVGVVEPVPVFVIQDKVTKQYYAGYDYQSSSDLTHWVYKLNYSEKLTKAKKFNRLADVRTHVLVQSGYYDDLPAAWGDVPDWMCGSKSFDIPDTWEIVKIDKLTKDEMKRIELIDTFNRSWRLRELTVKYGSAVRQVYSDLEKKGKLGEYSAMMYFSIRDNDKYRYDYELTEEEKAGVQEMIERFDKTELKAHKTKTGFAVAVKDDGTAAMARLMYTGKLDCGIVNFTTMQEVVT